MVVFLPNVPSHVDDRYQLISIKGAGVVSPPILDRSGSLDGAG